MCFITDPRDNLSTTQPDKGFERGMWAEAVNVTSYTLPEPLPPMKQ